MRRGTERLEPRGSDPNVTLSLTLLDGLCIRVAQEPIRVEGAVYSATKSVDTALLTPWDKDFRGGDTPEEGLVVVPLGNSHLKEDQMHL